MQSSAEKIIRKINALARRIGDAINFSDSELIKRDIIQHIILHRIYTSDIKDDLQKIPRESPQIVSGG